MHEFILAFVVLFVAMDILGLLPVYLTLTESLPPEVRKRLEPAGEFRGGNHRITNKGRNHAGQHSTRGR